MFGHTRDEFRNYQTKVLIEEPPNLLFLGIFLESLNAKRLDGQDL
jgi:hypothetical protein